MDWSYAKEYLTPFPTRDGYDEVEVSNRPWLDNVKDYYLTKEQRDSLLKDWYVIVHRKQHKSWRSSD